MALIEGSLSWKLNCMHIIANLKVIWQCLSKHFNRAVIVLSVFALYCLSMCLLLVNVYMQVENNTSSILKLHANNVLTCIAI